MHQPQYPQPWSNPPPPEKRKFRFQLWMLGALIIPVGIGFAVRDLVKKNSIELGGECSDSDHCKSHTCLLGGSGGVCSKSCSTLDKCPAGFACEPIKMTLKNQAGFHDLGSQNYCLAARAGATPAESAPTPSASATPPASAAPPPPEPTASAKPAATPAPKATPKPKAKPKK